MNIANNSLFDNKAPSLQQYRISIQTTLQQFEHNFFEQHDLRDLITQWSNYTDKLLIHLWRHYELDKGTGISLIAVGGFGRQELFPASDIDLLVLVEETVLEQQQENITRFIQACWDIRLPIGISVRNTQQCVDLARNDVSVITNLIEARLLTGSKKLYQTLNERITPSHLWSSRDFFKAKVAEQQKRHAKYDDTAYNLEPNIKNGPGGLRDIQTIAWIAKRHFGVNSLKALVSENILTKTEYETLYHAQTLLWKIRTGLHFINHRAEEHLLFNHQQTLAKLFGFSDKDQNLAVEQFMKQYYRSAKDIIDLSKLLSQLFQEIIIYPTPNKPEKINDDFQLVANCIEVTNKDIFKKRPGCLFELFVEIAKNSKIEGIRAETIRLLRESRYLIDEKFRADPRNTKNFIQLLQQNTPVTRQLKRMNRYSILGQYIQDFGQVVGQMQHDLYHAYTVDQHTLSVVEQLETMLLGKYKEELPLCTELIQTEIEPYLIYLSALFHDIAKGRGGDHSTLGAEIAAHFCKQHDLSEDDANLVCWLVEYHLLLSITAQRRDIYDPDVINDFISTVKTLKQLNYLYVLTVADIRATNKKLWNGWKDSLLKELYTHSKLALEQSPRTQIEIIRSKKQKALLELNKIKINEESVSNLWKQFGNNYFLNNTSDDIVWHTENILQHKDTSIPLVIIRTNTEHNSTDIFIYSPDKDYLFACAVSVLGRFGLNIVEAVIITSKNNYTLDTFRVLTQAGEPMLFKHEIHVLKNRLSQELKACKTLSVQRRIPRQLRYFKFQPTIHFKQVGKRTMMELICVDRPGLLAQIGKAFVECNVRVQNAKITTLGERAEDAFYLTDANDEPITTEAAQKHLKETILTKLAVLA